jgi:hypothetical protein
MVVGGWVRAVLLLLASLSLLVCILVNLGLGSFVWTDDAVSCTNLVPRGLHTKQREFFVVHRNNCVSILEYLLPGEFFCAGWGGRLLHPLLCAQVHPTQKALGAGEGSPSGEPAEGLLALRDLLRDLQEAHHAGVTDCVVACEMAGLWGDLVGFLTASAESLPETSMTSQCVTVHVGYFAPKLLGSVFQHVSLLLVSKVGRCSLGASAGGLGVLCLIGFKIPFRIIAPDTSLFIHTYTSASLIGTLELDGHATLGVLARLQKNWTPSRAS